MAFKRRFARKRINRRRKAPRYTKKGRGQLRSNFVETLDAGYVLTNVGGVFGVSFASIPQHLEYGRLYRQFCITKLEVILVPEYNAAEFNAASYNSSLTPTFPAVAWGGVARISHAPVFSADVTAPSNEISVLTNNRCKVRQVTQNAPIFMSCRPVAALGQQNQEAILLNTAPVSKRNQWLSTDTNGANIVHKGIQYWTTQRVNGSNDIQNTCAKIFYRVHFALRDPK